MNVKTRPYVVDRGIDYTEKVVEIDLVNHLKGLGWRVYRQVSMINHDKRYRADVVGFHDKYSELGWFLFEVKPNKNNWQLTSVHKQILDRYIGAVFDSPNIGLVDVKPECFVFHSPWVPNPENPEEWWELNNRVWFWPTILRFFTRYGIGVLPNDLTLIYFCNEKQEWGKLALDPDLNSPDFDLAYLKKYLESVTNKKN